MTFKPDCLPAPAQLVGAYIELEIAKADNWMRIRLRHSWYFGGAEILSCLPATEKLQINFSLSLWSSPVVGWQYLRNHLQREVDAGEKRFAVA